MNSFNITLAAISSDASCPAEGTLQLPNDNLDTEGQPYRPAINLLTTPTPSCLNRLADKPSQTNCAGNCSITMPISKSRLQRNAIQRHGVNSSGN